MAEKPIIICTELIPATMDDRKTVTRILIKPQPKIAVRKSDDPHFDSYLYKVESHGRWKGKVAGGTHTREEFIKYAPYQKGDILCVKETYCHGIEWDDCKPSEVDPLCGGNDIWYLADGPRPSEGWGKTRSARFMPKWAARIWRKVLDVRPEELQEITNEDAIKEGIERLFKLEDIGKPGIHDLGGWRNYLWHGCAKGKIMEEWKWQYSDYSLDNPNAAKLSFSSLWQLINAKRGYPWESNPWVWRTEFERFERQEYFKQGSYELHG